MHLRRTPLSSCVDLAALATRTPGYTGADISALCREAALSALEEDLGAQLVGVQGVGGWGLKGVEGVGEEV